MSTLPIEVDPGAVLTSALDGCVQRFPERIALVSPDGTRHSFADLARRRDLAAANLAGLGIGPGDLVALTVPSDVDYVAVYLGAAHIGGVTCGVNPSLSAEEQASILEHLAPTLVVGAGGTGVDQFSVPAPSVAGAAPDPDRPVAIVLTSGTTGRPKGAVFANRQLDAILDYDGVRHAWGAAGPMLASTQFAHVGFMTKLPWYLLTGARLHCLGRWRADDALEAIATERISTLGGVAPQIALLCRSDKLAELDVSCVERIIAGGAASPPELVKRACVTFGADYSIRYSSTESGGVGTGTSWNASEEERTETVGRPRDGLDVRVVDDAGDVVPDGERGQVCLRSKAVMSGYWNDPEATAHTLVDGWLRTGDVGWIDTEGRLRLTGRGDDVYIRGGYNVHPGEVEAVLASCPGVADIAIAPRPDSVMGQVGVAVVVPEDPSAPPTLGDLIEHAHDRLARFKLPEHVVTAEAIPLTAMAKVDRRALGQLVDRDRN